jgi:uncharacterized protein (TIGR03084 family)
MENISTALAGQHAEFTGLLTGLDDAGWASKTRCPGWDVSDVVLHMAQTEELALASVRGSMDAARESSGFGDFDPFDVDAAAGNAVERQRGASPAELLARWQAAAEASEAAFAAADPSQRAQWVQGELAVRTLASTRLSECWVHSGDVASAIGVKLEPTDRLWHIARLAWRTLPYALKKAGQVLTAGVTLDLVAPDGSQWLFEDETKRNLTTIRGSAEVFCEVAARRIPGDESGLEATGPDRYAVLDLVRTFA